MSRRTFVRSAAVAGGVAAVSGTWLARSNSMAARWFRRLVSDERRAIAPATHKPDPSHWSDNQITFAWLGHASVFINFYGLRILTDPVLGNRCGISLGFGTLGPKRLIAPALTVKELPPVDVVLLSHAHYDHFDTPTLGGLDRRTWIASARATSDIMDGRFKNFTELKWNEKATYRGKKGELEVQAFEVKHWGRRPPSKIDRGYNGYVLRRQGKSLIFGGDTALTENFKSLRAQGPFAAAIMPIGAYQPWIWNHCTPEQALEMADMAGAQYILPVHHQTFKLSDEPAREPIERMAKALEHEPQRLAWREIGETFVCPA